MIDFNYTAPELLPLRIQEVLDAPNEPHRIGDVVYVPEGGGECDMDAHGNCTACGEFVAKSWEYVRRFDGGYKAKPCRAHNYCPNCGAKIRKAVER